jgi:hypothetical protein
MAAEEFDVVIRFKFVTKKTRGDIATTAWAIVETATNTYGPDVRSGELLEIVKAKPKER